MFFQTLRLPRHDVIVTLTDPPLQLVMGPLLRLFKRTRLVHWAQDIYPEVAEELGVVRKKGFLANTLRRLSTWALRQHHQIIAVGECMKERLIARGISPEKIAVIPNWAQSEERSSRREEAHFISEEEKHRTSNFEQRTSNQESFAGVTSQIILQKCSSTELPPSPEGEGRGEGECNLNTDEILSCRTRFRRTHGWHDHLVVMYSGNFGLAHPFDSIVKAVKQLEKSCPLLLFVFIGEGSQLPVLREQIATRTNVRFLPSQPKTLLAETLAAADLHLAGMHDNLCGLVVPSKVYGVLAAQRLCLFLGPEKSEAAQTILRHQCGAVLPESDDGALVDWLSKWAANPNRIQQANEQLTEAVRSVSLSPALEAFDHLLRATRSR